jgi:TonB family protein
MVHEGFWPGTRGQFAGTYGYRLTEGQARLREFLSQLTEKKGELVIERVKESPEPGEGYVAQAIRQSIKEPVIFYSVSWQSSSSSPGLSIGYFTFIDGGFRRIDVGVLHILDAFKSAIEVRAGTNTPKRIRVGGMVMTAKLINKVAPRYPVEAKKRGIQGTVRVHVLVDKEGIVRDVELISGDPLLAEAAVQAVRQWRYQSTLLNGEPVEVETAIEVVFTLSR